MRSVHQVGDSDVFKALYFDRQHLALKPNLTFVNGAGEIVFETNEVGLKGDPVDERRKLAVVWGDSVVFGSGRGWACLLDELAPGYQFLNGGLDGDPYDNVLRRCLEFNRRHRVALNLLMLGWHHFVPERPAQIPARRGWLGNAAAAAPRQRRAGNENLRRDLTAFLREMPDTVVLTMPTALNPAIVDCDLSGYLRPGGDADGFMFIGAIPYQIAGQQQGLAHITERNAITREVCAALGVRLIDLFAIFDTTGAADFREHFYDILHFRPRSYPLLARTVYDGIKDLLT